MLKYKADIRTLLYLTATTAMLLVNWNYGFHPITYIFSLYLAITITVIAHNHNHVPMWKNQMMNTITDYWITLFYGFPIFAWIPTHNRNHHHYTNREGDHTLTYRVSEANNVLTLLSYPAITSYFQQNAIVGYLSDLWKRNRSKFFISIGQYVALGAFILGAIFLDWQKAVMYIIIPDAFALFTIMIINYIQHVHADEESEYNHSRNFVSKTSNAMLFNGGLHTAHHLRANVHWSELPALHATIDHLIDTSLKERGFWPYIFRVYIFSLFVPRFRTNSMRLKRQAHSVTSTDEFALTFPKTFIQ